MNTFTESEIRYRIFSVLTIMGYDVKTHTGKQCSNCGTVLWKLSEVGYFCILCNEWKEWID